MSFPYPYHFGGLLTFSQRLSARGSAIGVKSPAPRQNSLSVYICVDSLL